MTQPEARKTESEQTSDCCPSGPPAAAAPRRGRWYQFSLWTLFALTLLATVLLMGWRAMVAPYLAQADTMALVERLGGSYQSQPAPRWMSRVAGQELGDVTLVNLADCDQPDEYVADVARLPRLEILVVGGQAFGDEQTAQLSRTKSLRWLILDSTSVSADALAAVQDANPDLQVYRSQRRTIAAIRAANGNLNSWNHPGRVVSVAPELYERVGADFFEEPTVCDALPAVDVARVTQLSTLTEAYFFGPITDAQVAEIAKMPNLESVGFWKSPISDGGLLHLSGMSRLRRVRLIGSRVTDAGLACLTEKKELRYLELRGTQVGDAGLGHLAGLTNLEELYIGLRNVSDAGLIHLRGLTRLKALHLGESAITDAAVATLRNHNDLEALYLSGTLVTDAGLEDLVGKTKLKDLWIDGTRISDKGLAELKELKNLERLLLDGTKITDAGIPNLAALAKLQQLRLQNTQITDAAVEHLAKLASLTKLDVTDTRITNEGLARLQKALPGCQILSGMRKPKTPTPSKAGQ